MKLAKPGRFERQRGRNERRLPLTQFRTPSSVATATAIIPASLERILKPQEDTR